MINKVIAGLHCILISSFPLNRLGDQDIRDVVNSSIASSRDGATFETVEGQMICDTEPGYIGNSVVNLEWTLRTPGSVN